MLKSVMAFTDKIHAHFIAGNGGIGKVSFDKSENPTGGFGGRGGHIFIVGDEKYYDLSHLQGKTKFTAENGTNGEAKGAQGRSGKDLVIRVPLVTNIYNREGKLTHRVQDNKQKIEIATGGEGGIGNAYFGRTRFASRYDATRGKDGERVELTLELELQADVIFIGLPNAGKSSMINEICNAYAKVGDYAFTTTLPKLGRSGKVTYMDLPGLIEGAHTGKGLGTKFTRHTRSAKLLVHFVSLESDDPVGDYKLIRKELNEIGSEIASKPELIVLSKSDAIQVDQLDIIRQKFIKMNPNTVTASVLDENLVAEVRNKVEELLSYAQ